MALSRINCGHQQRFCYAWVLALLYYVGQVVRLPIKRNAVFWAWYVHITITQLHTCMHIIKSPTNFGLYFLFYLPIALQQKFATFLVINILIQFLLCGWSLAMREHLPSSVEIYIDDSFVEFLDKFSRTKVDNLHLWNRMQSQVTLTHTHTYIHTFTHLCVVAHIHTYVHHT